MRSFGLIRRFRFTDRSFENVHTQHGIAGEIERRTGRSHCTHTLGFMERSIGLVNGCEELRGGAPIHCSDRRIGNGPFPSVARSFTSTQCRVHRKKTLHIQHNESVIAE